jgi:ABC-2 type transport system permease protein
MKLHRIYGMMLRNLFSFKTSADRLVDAFYWPTIDIVVWGLTSQFFTKNNIEGVNLVTVVLSGIILWIVLWKSQYEVSINLLDELWNKNLVNIFVTPLKFSEWVGSTLILGLIKVILSLSFATFLAYILYSVRFFEYGFSLLPFMGALVISGWIFGFFITGLILRFGSKIQTISWSLIWLFAPFCGIYYPVSTLPEWAQIFSKSLPMSYVFEGMREVIGRGVIDWQKVGIAYGLDLVYLLVAIWFLKSGFAKSMQKGLIKVN